MFIGVVDGSKIRVARGKIGPTNFHCWHPSHAFVMSAPRHAGPTLDHIRLLSLALITARLSRPGNLKYLTVVCGALRYIPRPFLRNRQQG